jgi:mannose-6-phosphate isomerase-like protein (cupin superfamily)
MRKTAMKHLATGKFRGEFEVLARTRNAQAAMMTLKPGGASDEEPGNEHPAYEQWLFVVSGTGEARIGNTKSRLRRLAIKENSLLVIEKGEMHQIRNTGRKPLVTLNLYVPPAYNASGEPLAKA